MVDTPRTALVTGAGRGIGRAIALGLASAGWSVGLVGRTRSRLDAVAEECRALGVGAPVAAAGLVDPGAATSAVGEVLEAFAPHGGLGLLVNNAGVVESAELPFAQDDPADMWRVIEANVRGPLLVTHAVLPGMLARGAGRVVNLNSGAGHRPMQAYTGYSISKGAIARLTRLLDAQYRDAGLRVFDLAPGVVRTDMTASMPTHDDRTEWTPVEAVVELVQALGAGELDVLSGRFMRAGADTPASLLAEAERVVAADARVLRLADLAELRE
ncbi:SDR family NAD(P)-dependent oxidoreductase [Cellulomonas timonensis]|uniref:SDR family NAD(P)-dependent oxidoreductase n=1 Tax=Cellulomonas timonensis TaxID=1689271 RepID=UPI001F35ABAC|nr:SDR family NAD(P)-dependent oxidoreductase [Cellulomonas timonensis]